jgi:ParB-like chromosome segregation protein Spo0J
MLEVRSLPVGSLKPAGYNPRVISGREMAKLRQSLRRFGFVEPLVVRRADGLVLGGHQRLRAACEEGLAEVPCVLVDCSDAEAKLLNLALNKIGGSWDVPRLAELLAELSAADAELGLTGFEPDEVDRLLGRLAEEDISAAVAEPPPEPAAPPAEVRCPRCGKRFAADGG